MDIHDFLSRLAHVKKEGSQWKAECPAHADSSPSLAIRDSPQGVLYYCHGGCSSRAVLDALNLRVADVASDYAYQAKKLRPDPVPVAPHLDKTMAQLYDAIIFSARAQDYIESRAIPLNLIVEYGLGWAPRGHWPHYFTPKDGSQRKLCRQADPGRIVFPHTDLNGQIVNLYGRAASNDCQREQRHDHLQGNRGIFNAPAINDAKASGLPLWVCEGPFDALSAIAAGAKHAIAIFGLKGWREDWMDGLDKVIIAFDSDGPGRDSAKQLKRRIGGQIGSVEIFDDYRGAKDLNQALIEGNLKIDQSGQGTP